MGAGYHGLHATGVNGNRGAESTLAVISTLQHALIDGAATTGSTLLTPGDEKRRKVVDIGQLGCERTCSTKRNI
jgi:hypothetical protein